MAAIAGATRQPTKIDTSLANTAAPLQQPQSAPPAQQQQQPGAPATNPQQNQPAPAVPLAQ
jgi:hypothetical protein